MAAVWTTPRTWTNGEIPTKAIFDTHMRDNLDYLKAVVSGGATQNVSIAGTLTSTGTLAATAAATVGTTLTVGTGLTVSAGGAAITGASTMVGSLMQSGGYAYLGSHNVGTPTYPRAGTDIAIGYNFNSGSRDVALFNTDTASPTISFSFSQLTGGSASTSLAYIATPGNIHAIANVYAAGTTVSSGGFSFTNDTNTGMFRSASDTIGFVVGGNSRAFMAESGSLYGENAPYLQLSGARMVVAVGSVVPLIVDREVNDGTIISLRQGGTEEGSISVSSTTVAYNTFTGAHMTQLKAGQEEPPAGGVVITTGEIVQSDNVHYIEDVVEEVPDMARDGVATGRGTVVRQVRHDRRENSAWREVRGETKDYLPYVAGTTNALDPAVYGVWIGMVREDAAGSSFGKNGLPVYNVAGLGTFEVRVTDSGGDIAAGDLLCTSPRRYEAQKQADDVIRAGTLGKALSGIAWADVPIDRGIGYRWRLISVALYCG